jgi:hypothetical protein
VHKWTATPKSLLKSEAHLPHLLSSTKTELNSLSEIERKYIGFADDIELISVVNA